MSGSIVEHEYVIKLHKMNECMNHSHCIVHRLTGLNQKFEYVMKCPYHKIFSFATKFGYVFKPGRITLHTMNNHPIIDNNYKGK